MTKDRAERLAQVDATWEGWLWIVTDDDDRELARGKPSEVADYLMPFDGPSPRKITCVEVWT